MVGGEKLECKEAARYFSHPDCSFVWEHIDNVQQGPLDAPYERYDEYRPVDFETLDLLRDKVKDWVESFDSTVGHEGRYRVGRPELIIEYESFVRATGHGPSQKTLREIREYTD
eukprot:1882833-Karenia_brevis.AAC.1